MAKRTASSDLNRDNWEEEDEPEEMGTYKTASVNELKMRSIKRAKRRGVGDGEGASVFKDFKGFGSVNSESSTPAFSFLSNNMDKPKLICPTSSFPSFSFSKSPDATKTSDVSSALSTKASSEKPTIPTFTFTLQPTVDKTACNDIEKQSLSNSSFKFGVDVDKTTGKSDSPLFSSFNFNPSKSSDNGPAKKEETSFKFGVDSPQKRATNSSAKSFQFGSKSPNKADRVGGSALLGESKANDNGIKEPKILNVNGLKNSSENESKENNLFLANLKALNLGVLKWVQQHLDKNQYINLTPIFEDYNVHFQEIKKKFNNDSGEDKCKDKNEVTSFFSSNVNFKNSSESKDNSSSSSSASLFTFGSSNAKVNQVEPSSFGAQSSSVDKASESSKKSEPKPFSFGLSDSSKKGDASDVANKPKAPLFTFGNDKQTSSLSFNATEKKSGFTLGLNENKQSTSDFSFGSSKDNKTTSGFNFQKSADSALTTGFSFSSNSQDVIADKDKDKDKSGEKDEPTDEVPEEKVIEVKEDDAVYEKKVKLFYKKGDQYASIGLGTLFLKPVGEKTQLIVRTQTNLGQILLNIFLYESIPTQRVGKNNVMLVCIPNPPIDPKAEKTPASILIRVKTESDADELLEQVNKYKKI